MLIGYCKPRTYQLTPRHKKYGKILARGKRTSFAFQCMKDEESKRYILKHVGNILREELRHFCSDTFNSMLLHSDASDLKAFDYNDVLKEAKECTPVLHQLLTLCLLNTTPKRNTNAVISAIICLLAKHRRNRMNLFQKVVSLLLYGGHCSKMVHQYYHA